jgi:hypothetical protein
MVSSQSLGALYIQSTDSKEESEAAQALKATAVADPAAR